jgi:hypothetical protein
MSRSNLEYTCYHSVQNLSSQLLSKILRLILVRKLKGKIPFGSPRYRLDYNAKLDLRQIGWEGVDLIHLVQDRHQWQALVNMVMNLWV